MLHKEFKSLTTREKFILQKIMLKKRTNKVLTIDEHELYCRFFQEYGAAEKVARSKWPIIIILFTISLFDILRAC